MALKTEEERYQAWSAKQDAEDERYKIWSAEQDKLEAEKKAQETPEELPTRSVGAFAKDVGTSLEKGIIGAEQSLVGLADIPTGGHVGKYLQEQGFDFEKNQKLLSEQYSPQQKAENKALEEAHGVMGTIGAALSSPTAVGAMLGESVPSIFAGGILGKVAKVAKGVSAAGAAGLGEGLIAAGGAEENIRNQSEDGLVSGKGTLAAIGTGIGTGVLGALGAKATHALGGIDADTLFMGGARREAEKIVGAEAAKTPGVFKKIVASALGEGVLEEAPQSAQEQMWQNYATDNPKGLLDGVPESATKGALLGSLMGGVVGGFSNTQTPPAATGEEEQGYKEELTPQAEAVLKKSALKSVGLGPTHKMHEEMMQQDFSTPEGIAAAEAFVQGNSEKLGGINDDAWNRLIAASKEKAGVVEQAPAVKEEVKAPVVEEVKAPVVEEEVKAPVVKEEVKAPKVKKVKAEVAPVVEEVKVPVVEEVKAPVVEEVKAPKVKKVKAEVAPVVEQTQAASAPVHTPKVLIEGFKTSRPTNFSTNTQVKNALAEQGVPEEQNTLELQQQIRAAHNAQVQSAKKVTAPEAQVTTPEDIQIDEAKVSAYDSALERASVLAEGGSKGAVKPFMKYLLAKDLINLEQMKVYEGKPLAELMQAINTDLQTGRDKTASTPVTSTKIIPHTAFGTKTTKATPIKKEGLLEVEKNQQAADVLRANVEAKKAKELSDETEELAELKKLREVKRAALALEKTSKKGAKPIKTTAPTEADLNAKVTAARPRKKSKAITQEEIDYATELSEQGEHDYSVAPTSATTGHTAASISKSLSPELKRLVASGKAVIHDTAEDLNKVVLGSHPANVQGLTTKEGVTHYVANKLTPKTIQQVALHEAGVHAGIEKMIGAKAWADIKHQALTNKGAAFEAARAAIPANTPERLRAEEALAYLVENSPRLPIVRRIIAAIRNWARTTLGVNSNLTEDDARHLAEKALRKESKTAERTVREETAYSLSPSEQASVAAGEARVGTPAVKPPKTPFYKNIDSVISNQETKYLSYDAKFINTLRNSIKKLGLPVQAMQKLMLRASQSQTVQATATAGAAATQGDIKYNPNSFNWEAVAGKHSAPRLRQFIEDMAVAKGESYATVNKIFGDIMVAARIDEIYKKAAKIKAKIKADKAAIRGMQAHIDTLTNKQDIIDASEILKTAENTLRRYRLNNIKKLRIAVNEQQHMSKKEVAQHMRTLAANPEYRAPLEEWQGIRKSVIEFLVASGRYSQEQADAYMDAVSYVPFQRIMHDMDEDSDTAYVRASERTVGKAGLSAGQRERAMRGSAREVDDIVSNIEKWVVNSYIKGIKAAKSKELIDLADSYLPPGAVTELKGPELGAVTCYREGVKEYWHFDDPFMTFAFNGINNPLVIPTLKTGARVANKLREFIVLNPLFTISQLPQDTFAAMMSSGVKHPFALPLEVIKEFGATLFNTQRAKTGAHAKLAAIGATGQKDFVDSFASSIHDIAYGGDVKKKSALVKHLEHIAMAGDNAVRQAVYNRTLKEMKGHPHAEAIAQERAFEIINFRRKGASATLDGIRQITPFFGAYLQAQRVALNVLSGRGIAPTERKEAMRTLAITTAKVAAFTVLYNMVLGATGTGGDDEDESDFTKRNIKDRDKKMFVPGTKATLPLRQDVFSIPFIVANHVYQYMFEKGTKNPAEAWKAVGMAVLHTFPGVGMPMGPTIAKPWLEISINHDFFTGRDITPMRLQGKDTSLQYNEQTSEIAKMLGKTGFINPLYVDHIVKGMLGYVGGAGLAVSDMAIRAGLDTPYMEKGVLGKGVRDIPGMTSLWAKDYDPKDVDTYYTMRTEIDKVNDTYNALKKLGKREEAREYKADNRLALKEGVHQQLNKMVSKVDAINEKIRKLAETPNEVMSPEVKRARRDQLDAKIRHIESGINRLYPRVHPE